MRQCFLKQIGYSATETREIAKYGMISDTKVLGCEFKNLNLYSEMLQNGTAIPVGTVEFVRHAMEIAGIQEPENNTYPDCLKPFLKRKIKRKFAGSILGTAFVKPLKTKLFTGFVFDTFKEPEQYPEHDREQFVEFLKIPSSEYVWESEVVNWNSEHRYYVLEGKILGHARYDSGPDEWPDPDQEQVEKMVEILSNLTNTPVAYALDVGVLDNGSTALVEFNDAWAIGLYRGAISAEQYALFLQHRWNQLFKEKP